MDSPRPKRDSTALLSSKCYLFRTFQTDLQSSTANPRVPYSDIFLSHVRRDVHHVPSGQQPPPRQPGVKDLESLRPEERKAEDRDVGDDRDDTTSLVRASLRHASELETEGLHSKHRDNVARRRGASKAEALASKSEEPRREKKAGERENEQ